MESPEAECGSQHYRQERHFARQCTLQFLYQCDVQDLWDDFERRLAGFRRQVLALDTAPAAIDFDRAWHFAVELAHGVRSYRAALDRLISEAAINWTIERMSLVDRNILRLAVYEIRYAEGTPPVTAVDEGVELAKEFGHADSKRFVNGVLDRILRSGDALDSAGTIETAPESSENDSREGGTVVPPGPEMDKE